MTRKVSTLTLKTTESGLILRNVESNTHFYNAQASFMHCEAFKIKLLLERLKYHVSLYILEELVIFPECL